MRAFTFSEWVGLVLATIGIVLSITAPWPAAYVRNLMNCDELTARVVTCIPVVLCVGIVVVVPPTVWRLRPKHGEKGPRTFKLQGRVSERKLHEMLLVQLDALVGWLRVFAQDLLEEDEASRENLCRHREAIQVLLDEEESLLDPKDPGIQRAATSALIVQHLAWRKYAQTRLRRIQRCLHPRLSRLWRRLDTTFGVAARNAASLRRNAEKEYKRLKTIDRRTLSTK